MPTPPRPIAPNTYHHVYNRGSQKMTLFHSPKDYTRFLLKIQEYKERYPVDVLAYCIMPNHFHFLLREPEDPKDQDESPLGSNIADFLHVLQTSYSKYFQALHSDFSGRIFQGTYQSKLVDQDTYLQYLSCYIHFNPQAASLVKDAIQWPYSSLACYTHHRPDGIVNPTKLPYEGKYEDLYYNYIQHHTEKDINIHKYIIDP